MKVLDLSEDVAGRFAAKLFAMDGAEVFRCCPDSRCNNALSIYLDSHKTVVQREQLSSLLEQCELVLSTFRQGALRGFAQELFIPDGCVHITTSSFGMTGPYANWRGGPMADWAAGGYLYITGSPDREPLMGSEHLCAYAAGYTAAIAAEAALVDKLRTGRGRHVDISVMESMLMLHQSTFSRAGAGELRQRTGCYTEVYPLTVLPCRDGYISIGVVSDAEFDKLAIAIEKPELSIDPRFCDRLSRWQHRDELDGELGDYFGQHDAEDVVSALQANGVACAQVAELQDMYANPQLNSRKFWDRSPEDVLMPGNPLGRFNAHCDQAEQIIDRQEENNLPLSGVRVLDFTIFWAGPSATRTLSDLGADVVWVEQPNTRFDTYIDEDEEAAPQLLQQHLYDCKMFRGKKSIQLDLRDPEDRKIAHQLAMDADIVVENFRPGVANKLGIGVDELSR